MDASSIRDRVTGPELDGPAARAAARQVTQELRAIVGHRPRRLGLVHGRAGTG